MNKLKRFILLCVWYCIIKYQIRNNKPVYIKHILLYTKYVTSYYACEMHVGLCRAIVISIIDLLDIHIDINIKRIIPIFGDSKYVIQFNGDVNNIYWWSNNDWFPKSDRMNYIEFLIDFYKTDKTNLRNKV